MGKRIVYAATPDRASQTLSIGELAFAGSFSAIPATLVAAPAERVKVLLQVSSGDTSQKRVQGKLTCTAAIPLSAHLIDPAIYYRSKDREVRPRTLAQSTSSVNFTPKGGSDPSSGGPWRPSLATVQVAPCEYQAKMSGEVTECGVYRYFATYELLKRRLSGAPPILPNGETAAAPPLSLPAVMLAGGSAGVAMWALAIPPDVSDTPAPIARTSVFVDRY